MWRRPTVAVAIISIIVLGGLSFTGTVLSPDWDPPDRVAGTVSRAGVSSPMFQAAAAGSEMSIEKERVSVRARGAVLDGIVVAPAKAGTYLGIALVHGSGQSTASDLIGLAERLARRGIVALAYDKSAEYSPISHSFHLLAEDALAATRLLRKHPQVNEDRVGLWGFSEGGWVAPIAAARAPDAITFIILASPPNVPPLRQAAWALDAALRRLDATPSLRALMARRLSAGRFVNYVSHEPAPVLRRVTQPVLALYGAHD